MASPAPRLGRAVAAAMALATAAAGGCDTGDGRELQSPPPGATAPPLPTSSTATSAAPVVGPPVGSEDAVAFLLASPAFDPGTAIPSRHASCEGDNVSPPLVWNGVPAGAVELALTVRDPDAPDGDFVHWVVAGLSPVLTGLGEGAVPEGAVEARNDTSEFGWFGPCPPPGETHAYLFTLYALGSPSGVDPGAAGIDAIAAIEAASIASTTLSATYGRPATTSG